MVAIAILLSINVIAFILGMPDKRVRRRYDSE